jgi:hypothetical protein
VTAIRRIALVITLILLVLDCVALGLVKIGGGDGGSFNLVAMIDKADQAKKVKAALEKEGFKAAESRADKKTQVLDGYKVLIDNPSAVEPMYQTLRHEKVPVKKNKEGTVLFLNKPFKNKRLAEQAAAPLKKYGMKVEENFKDVTVKAYRLELKNLPLADADKAEAIFDEQKVAVDREKVTENK